MKTFGGVENDFAHSVLQTSDGGYIISGQTDSFGGASSGKADMWIIKLDQTGKIEWNKTYGGAQGEAGFFIQQTSGEGYVIAGTTASLGKGYPSMWIVRLDNMGDTIWTRLYEGNMVSSAQSITQTSDGGYIVAGKGDENILKLNMEGKKEWGRRYGWIFYSVDLTADGGFILGGDSIYQQMEWDYIPSLSLVKLGRDGRMEWNNPFRDRLLGRAYSVRQTKDGGYIVAGDSIDLKSGYDHSHYLLVFKLDKDGEREWTYYGSEYSGAQSVRQTADEGFIVSGNTTDTGHGLDVLLIRFDNKGKKVWSKTFGKSDGWEYAADALQTSDKGYIVAGQADSYGAGRYDWWVLKLDENGNGSGPTGIPGMYKKGLSLFQNYPNPFNKSTTIGFYLSEPGFVTLKIYNLAGKELDVLYNNWMPAGQFTAEWTPGDLPSGIYFYQLKEGKHAKTKSLVVQK